MPIVDLSLDINATSADKEVLARMSKEIELALPDSDEFADIEGTLAQNALISAIYAIQYIQSGDMADFCSSVDKALETVDALGYYETNSYAEDVVMAREVGVLESLVQVAGLQDTGDVFAKLAELARTYPVYGELPAKYRTRPS
jgi:hypothetical protein